MLKASTLAQAVEHYEIMRYGTLISWAKELGYEDCATLLTETLREEVLADEKLTEVAETRVNQLAAQSREPTSDRSVE